MLFNTASPAFEKPIPLYILLPLHPFVQADMLSACIEYEDILSAITYGVSIWREITYTAATNTLTNDYTVSVGKMEIKQNKSLYKKFLNYKLFAQ